MIYNYYLNFLRNKNEANPLAYLIRSAENTEYNHVEISREIIILDKVTDFFSAVWPMSRRAEPKDIDAHYIIIKRRKLTVLVSDADAEKIIFKYLGKEYSILQNLNIAFKLAFHQFKNYFASVKLNLDKYLNCTEYCARFLEEGCGKKFVSTESVSLKDLDNDGIGELC